ncbi:DUF6445 family protein [Marinimicrobium sp. C6131]|uniref:DUF6445 family protein n=1 Tax=Marinimicrobium sp. C6131 TaxID=3022676 RepID=UPI00223D70E0|nr:DUF6445 family protein [Marinimicrobium sp. C6131]UZJ44550.1 DUF6445 family protein [Marinimicrobium sp. C6131]
MTVSQELSVQFNPGARVSVNEVGVERQPVVCIDDFLLGAEALRADAIARKGFDDNTGFYPGLRSAAPPAYYQALQDCLPGLVERVFGIRSGQIASVECSYSLVTTRPDDLHPVQRIPHFDSNRPTELAMVHFLCGPELGGTSFYRHRDTGFEYVDAGRRERFLGALEADANAGRLPPPGYINGDTDQFERIASYEAAFNRLLLYRCTSLHSGNIAEGFDFDTDPAKGRLSINTFLLNG